MGQLYSHLVFRPPSVPTYDSTTTLRYVTPDSSGMPTIHTTLLVWLATSLRNRIPCAWTRANANVPSDYVILYAHQNGEDLGTSIRDAHLLSKGLNLDVFSFEYSGYGLSERPRRSAASNPTPGSIVCPSGLDNDRARAEPSEKACCSDIDAAYTYLTDVCAVPPANIIVFGRSIGSGPAVYAAASRKVAGLVLIAPMTSAVRVALKKCNITLPFIDTFPNIDRAAKIRCPVLVVHGDMDELVPKLHGERLFEKIRANGHAVQPLWIPTAMHNNVVEDFQSIVFGRYVTFLDELKAIKVDHKSIDHESRRRRVPASKPQQNSRRRQRMPIAQSCLRAPRISVDDISVRDSLGDDTARRKNSSCMRPLRDHQPWRRVSSAGNVSLKRASEASCLRPPRPKRVSRGDPIAQNFCVQECGGKCDGDCAAEDDLYLGFARLESFSSDGGTHVDNPRRWQVLVPPSRHFTTNTRIGS